MTGAASRPRPVSRSDVDEARAFLAACDPTVAGLDTPGVQLWAVRDLAGSVVGAAGFERSPDGSGRCSVRT